MITTGTGAFSSGLTSAMEAGQVPRFTTKLYLTHRLHVVFGLITRAPITGILIGLPTILVNSQNR